LKKLNTMFKAYQNIDISTTPSPSLTLTQIQSNVEGYRCIGSGTNFTITLTGSPLINMATFLLWEASASGTVTIFGTVMPTEFKTKKTLVTCTYDGAAWKVVFNISGDESGYIIDANVASNAAIARTKIASGTNNHVIINNGSGVLSSEAQLATTRGGTNLDTSSSTGVAKVSSGTWSVSSVVNADINASAAIAYSKLATLNTGQILIGNAGVPTAATMSGDATISNAGALTIANNAVTTVKILDGNVTGPKIPNDTITVNHTVAALRRHLQAVDISFEAGELGAYKIRVPWDCTLDFAYSYVTKAIAATDNGTITFKDNAGTVMDTGAGAGTGIITYTASTARNSATNITFTGTNTFSAGELLTIESAKTTAGGKVLLSLRFSLT
jgi:hypothetical protein